MNIQVVDYQSPDAPQAFTQSLLETGFAVITNHPIAWSDVETMFSEWDSFFDHENRFRYDSGDGTGGGYFPPSVAETAKGYETKDLKEFYHVYPWAQYPDEVSRLALDYAQAAQEVALTLLGWVEANTPPEVAELFSVPLSSMMDNSRKTLLRILRYGPLTGQEDPRAVRAAAHKDINLLTVLPSSNEPGLQLKGLDGDWVDVPCDPASLAVNTGEMLELASGGYYPATVHQVTNPTGEAAKRSRMAAPLFLHPADDVVLADGRTASSFLAERIAELRS